MIGRIAFTVFLLIILVVGFVHMDTLMHASRTEGIVLTIRTGRKSSTYPTVRFSTPQGGPYQAEVSGNGEQKIGQTMTIMYRENDPAGTAKAYFPNMNFVPIICFAFSILGILFIWSPGRKIMFQPRNKSQA